MGGKTGTTNDNSDCWFFGYTPQLLAGVWIGCDDRFIRLENNNLGQGAQAARPVWEYFFAKTLADKTLGVSRQVKFIQPENMKSDMMYDYMKIIDQTPPPGAEGANQGNGNATQYFDTSSPKIPVDSKLSPEEKQVLKEATVPKKNDKNPLNIIVTDADKKPPLPKKKDGFFKRLFGGNKDK
jgi:penicillin-binding protein 1A